MAELPEYMTDDELLEAFAAINISVQWDIDLDCGVPKHKMADMIRKEHDLRSEIQRRGL